MQELEKIKDALEGNAFTYQEAPHLGKKEYVYLDADVVRGKIKLETDIRTFLIDPKEVETFIDKCLNVRDFREYKPKENNKLPKLQNRSVYVPNQTCDLISNGLIDMFTKIASGAAKDEDFKASKAMVDISGKLIDIEKIKIQMLNQ
jgi:hypothetical protein